MPNEQATEEYLRISAAIHALDQLQALYHRTGDDARRLEVQAAIEPLLARSHALVSRV